MSACLPAVFSSYLTSSLLARINTAVNTGCLLQASLSSPFFLMPL